MKCSKCNSIIDDNAKFCNNCGNPVISEIECLNCKNKNPVNSKFCKNCGNSLVQELVEKGESVVLDNEFYIKLHDIYFEKLLKRIGQSNDAVDPHSVVRSLDSSILQKEYSFVVKKCFDHLIDSSRVKLSKTHIDFIREKRELFFSEESDTLFQLLNDSQAPQKWHFQERCHEDQGSNYCSRRLS